MVGAHRHENPSVVFPSFLNRLDYIDSDDIVDLFGGSQKQVESRFGSEEHQKHVARRCPMCFTKSLNKPREQYKQSQTLSSTQTKQDD